MRKAVFSLLSAFICLTGALAQRPANLTGRVIDVAEGDTISIVDKRKLIQTVKLLGIDTPEKGQKYFDQSKQYLSDLIYGKEITVEGKSFDSYGRLRGKILLHGRDVNLEMVISGFAWHFNEIAWDQSERDRQLYESAELVARKSKFNIWADAKPVPPWEFADSARSTGGTNAATVKNVAATVPAEPAPSKPAVELRELALPATGKILGNKNSHIYHWPGCPGYTKIAEKNQVPFNTPAEAEAAGYRAAKNCTQ